MPADISTKVPKEEIDQIRSQIRDSMVTLAELSGPDHKLEQELHTHSALSEAIGKIPGIDLSTSKRIMQAIKAEYAAAVNATLELRTGVDDEDFKKNSAELKEKKHMLNAALEKALHEPVSNKIEGDKQMKNQKISLASRDTQAKHNAIYKAVKDAVETSIDEDANRYMEAFVQGERAMKQIDGYHITLPKSGKMTDLTVGDIDIYLKQLPLGPAKTAKNDPARLGK